MRKQHNIDIIEDITLEDLREELLDEETDGGDLARSAKLKEAKKKARKESEDEVEDEDELEESDDEDEDEDEVEESDDEDEDEVVKEAKKVSKKKARKESDDEDEDELEESDDEDEDEDEEPVKEAKKVSKKKARKESDDEDEDEVEESDDEDDEDEEPVKEAKKVSKKKARKESDDEDDIEDYEDEDEDEVEESDDEDEDEDEIKVEKRKSKKESVEIPKSKAGIIGAVYKHLSEMKKTDDVAKIYKRIMGLSEKIEEEEAKKDPIIEASKEELDALMEANESMDAEFRAKASQIFESAVKTRVDEELVKVSKDTIDRLEESFESRITEEVDQATVELIEHVDTYLNYIADQWIKKNEVAIENGLRTEIAENFINGLQHLFQESYITVPEGREDMVATLSSEVDKLAKSVNEQVEANIALVEEVSKLKREKVLSDLSKDLAMTESARLSSLVEDIEFDDEQSFRKKVSAIRESYFLTESKAASKKTTTPDADIISEDNEGYDEDEDPYIARVAKLLSKTA